ncbi:MAG TPA: hypothetical protein VFR43_05850 [Gaiellaceae bacterium]|nr:hypothetical protein [Gaiellaceae bacterium]
MTVRLTGWTAFAALARELRIRCGRSGRSRPSYYDRDGLRVGGTSVPFSDIRAGRFRRDGLKTFLFFADRVLAPALDRAVPGAGSDLVAVEADDPVGLAAEVERRLAAHGLH